MLRSLAAMPPRPNPSPRAVPAPLALLTFGVLSLAACAPRGFAPSRPLDHPPGARRADLVLLVVIDQLPWRAFEWLRGEGLGRLPSSHPWQRILREGRVRKVRLPYAQSLTAPGHASLSTGALPATHGVVANRWFEPARSRVTAATRIAGRQSAAALRVETVWQVAQRSGLRALSVALKDRGALFVAGEGVPALWFGRRSGQPVASSPLPWVADFARAHPASEYLGRVWHRSIPMRNRQTWASVPYHGLGPRFPHPLRSEGVERGRRPYAAFAATPFASTWLTDLAIEALRRERPKLLSVSFSPADLAGHLYGPDSAEYRDHLLRAGLELGRLLEAAEALVGKGRVTLLLTSDHGGPRVGRRDDRISAPALRDAIRGAGLEVRAFLPPNVVVAPLGRRDAQPAPLQLRAAVDALRRVPGVAHAFTADEVRALSPRPTLAEPVAGGDALQLLRNSFYAGRHGQLFVVYERGRMSTPHGATHGSPWAHDRDVPLLLLGAGTCDAPRARLRSSTDVAPSIARLLGLPAPAASLGEALPEVSCPR